MATNNLFIHTSFAVFLSIYCKMVFCVPLRDAQLGNGKIMETLLDGSRAIFHKRLTQQEAMSYCEANRTIGTPGRLVVLLKLEDATALIDKIYEKSAKANVGNDIGTEEFNFDIGLSRRYWIGLSDALKEGSWMWLKDGSELEYYDLWTRGQPDHHNKTSKDHNEHCVALWNPNFEKPEGNKHTFNDDNCARKYYFICEDYVVTKVL